MNAPIFISHSSKDAISAERLCQALENRGLRCWISSRDVRPGDNFQVAIVRAIRGAKVIVLIFSTSANTSEEIKKELALAGQSQLVVVPVRIEEVMPDEAFAYEFAIRQWVDLFEDWDQAIARLVRQLIDVIGIERAEAEMPSGPRELAPPVTNAFPSPARPLIAILPFENRSKEPDQQYFVEGLVEEIVTVLTRIQWLSVTTIRASPSMGPFDVNQIRRAAGVRYVLTGSIRKTGQNIRITGQLSDAATGIHLWADRLDGNLGDVFALQDELALSVAGAIEPAVQLAEIKRAAARPTSDLTAYDLYLRALPRYWLLSKSGVMESLCLLEQAIERDPHFGPALALAARCHLRAYLDGWADNAERERVKGIDRARRALAIARDDPITMAGVAFTLTEFGDDIRAMLALVDRALTLHPSYAHGWFLSGAVRLNAGECDLAIEHIEYSLRLAPHDRLHAAFTFLGYAYFCTRRFDEARTKLLIAVGENNGLPWPYWCLASCYAHMGLLAEACQTLEKIKALTPALVPSRIPWRNPEYRELLLSGLRLAADQIR